MFSLGRSAPVVCCVRKGRASSLTVPCTHMKVFLSEAIFAVERGRRGRKGLEGNRAPLILPKELSNVDTRTNRTRSATTTTATTIVAVVLVAVNANDLASHVHNGTARTAPRGSGVVCNGTAATATVAATVAW